MKRDITTAHRQLSTWLGKKTRSPEIAHTGRLVLNGLWACANNKNPSPILVNALVADVAAFERACRGSQ